MTVSKPVADFQRLLLDAQKAGTESSLFLQVMEPQAAHTFRLCVIPHLYDAEIVRLLLPSLDAQEAEQRCLEFSSLSAVTPVGESWAVHDKWRHEIFPTWLSADNREEFHGASRRLADFFQSQIDATDGEVRETAFRRRMYHLLGADQVSGLEEFERLCRRARNQLRYAECAALIHLVRDYDPVLTAGQRAIVSYHEGKLASDRRDWQAAERLFTQLVQETVVAPIVRAKSYLRLGYVFAQQGRSKEALEAFGKGGEIAESDPQTETIMPRILHELGVAYRDIGEQERAEHLLTESANRAASKEEWDSYAIAYNSLGSLYLKQRLALQAIRAFEIALERLDVEKDQLRTSQVYNNLGLAYTELGDWAGGESWFLKSLEIKRRSADVLGQALAFNNLLRVHVTQGHFEEAIVAATQATHYFRMGGDLGKAAVAQQNLGKAYRKLGKPDAARQCYDEAIKLFSEAHDAQGSAAARVDLESLDEKRGLPWWAWLAVILFGLLLLLLVVGLVFISLE
jgi:tetratricopeptide (TPR) repeat protein